MVMLFLPMFRLNFTVIIPPPILYKTRGTVVSLELINIRIVHVYFHELMSWRLSDHFTMILISPYLPRGSIRVVDKIVGHVGQS